MRKKIFCPNETTILRTIPSLAKEIGDDESRVLLQMEFLTFGSKYFFENRYWIFRSIRDLHDEYFNFWSISKLHRVISKLTDSYNFLLVGNFKKRNQDNTNWYAIHYEMLAELKSIVVLEVSDDEGKRKQVYKNDKPPQKIFIENDLFQNGTPCPILTEGLSQNETPRNQTETAIVQNGTPIDKTKQDSKDLEEREKITYTNFQKIFYQELEKIFSSLSKKEIETICKRDFNDSKVINFHLKEEDLPLKMDDLLGVARMLKELIERQSELDERGRSMARVNYPRYSIYELENRYKGIMTAYGQLPKKPVNRSMDDELKDLMR